MVEGVTQRTAPIGQLLDAGQRQALAAMYFGRGKQLSEGQLKKGLMQMAEICDDVNEIDDVGLKMELRKTLEMRDSMPIKDWVNAISVRRTEFLHKHKLSHKFLRGYGR